MKVEMLSPEAGSASQYLTSYVVDDRVAIDAGCLGFVGRPEDQERIRDVFLSHIHLDHVAALPAFVQNASNGAPVRAYGHAELLGQLRTELFNGRLWPDHPLRCEAGEPGLELLPLESEVPVSVAGLSITPVFVDHVVTTMGFVVDDGETAVAFGADSRPTDRIWEIARATGRWKGAFLEATFPDELAELADRTGHITPKQFGREVAKFPPGFPVVAVHLSPRHRRRIGEELEALGDPRIRVSAGRSVYVF